MYVLGVCRVSFRSVSGITRTVCVFQDCLCYSGVFVCFRSVSGIVKSGYKEPTYKELLVRN